MRVGFPIVAAFGLVLSVGCGPEVDCDKLEKRLNACAKDMILKIRPKNAERLKKATDPEVKKANAKRLAGDVQKLQEVFKTQVIKPCRAHKGRAKDAKLIQKCLDKKTCGEFAACFSVYLKEKSK